MVDDQSYIARLDDDMQAPKWTQTFSAQGEAVTASACQGLLGNGMHLAVLGALMTYIFCNSAPRDMFDGSAFDLRALSLAPAPASLSSAETDEERVCKKPRVSLEGDFRRSFSGALSSAFGGCEVSHQFT